MAGAEYPWERPLGAVPGGEGTVEFRVWAPHPERVAVRLHGADHELHEEGYGVRSARIEAADGDDYVFVLDVVYNHVGASGNAALAAYGPYFTGKYSTFWGEAINYDDADSDPVREWVLQSAEGWIRDFHVDGLRLDAIHAIFDSSAKHLLQQLAERVHARDHRALVISESGLNDPKVMRPASARSATACPTTPARSRRSARCSRRSCRCSSWARSTASARRSSSSPTTSTRTSRPRRARAAGASSRRSPTSRARRSRTRRTRPRSSARSSRVRGTSASARCT